MFQVFIYKLKSKQCICDVGIYDEFTLRHIMPFTWTLFPCGKSYALNRHVKARHCGVKNKIRTGLFLYKDYIYEIDKVFCENHLRHSRFILLLLYIKIAIIYDKRTRNKDLKATADIGPWHRKGTQRLKWRV